MLQKTKGIKTLEIRFLKKEIFGSILSGDSNKAPLSITNNGTLHRVAELKKLQTHQLFQSV